MNSNFKYIVGPINKVRKNIRQKLLLTHKRLTTNIFIDTFGNVIVLKSFVKSSNPNEWKYLNLTSEIYGKIKDKSITVMIIERYDLISIFHKKYNIKIDSLKPTQSLKNIDYGYSRFIINQSTKEEYIINEIYQGFKKVS